MGSNPLDAGQLADHVRVATCRVEFARLSGLESVRTVVEQDIGGLARLELPAD